MVTKLPKADALGHRTRFSDSSIYDEVCVLCGATDGSGDHRLKFGCPNAKTDEELMSDTPTPAEPERHPDEVDPSLWQSPSGKMGKLPKELFTLIDTRQGLLSGGTMRELLVAVANQWVDRPDSKWSIHTDPGEPPIEDIITQAIDRVEIDLEKIDQVYKGKKPFDIVPPPGYFLLRHTLTFLQNAARFYQKAAADLKDEQQKG